MRVSDFDSFETQGLLSGSKERSWIWFGLIVSLAIHFGLCAYFYRTRFQSAETAFAPNEQTPTFKVRSITESNLDKSSVDQTNQAAKPNPDNTDVQLPDEQKSFDKLLQDVQASAALPDDMRDVLPDQPKVEQPEVNSVLNEIERSTAQTLENDPNALHEQSLLNNSSTSGRPQPALSGTELATSTAIKRPNTFTSKLPGDSAGPNKGRAPGFSDSFGTSEYNLDLSQRRADSVKRYLVEVMRINPAQIETHGYGAAKFRASPNGSIEEQSANRRVEVVVHTSQG